MSKVDEAINIIKALGLPKTQQNKRSGLTLLALADIKKQNSWSDSKKKPIGIHDILVFIQKHYKHKYAENTRETIRRQTLHQFEQAGIVVRNADDPSRPTNSPHTVYSISTEALAVIKTYNSRKWQKTLERWVREQGRLADRYEKRRTQNHMSVKLPNGSSVRLSPGKHNKLQADIINVFRAKFCPQTSVIYLGDTARKMLHINKEMLNHLKIPITRHDKLPDIVLYDKQHKSLFLIEAVTAHGPLSPKRQIELEATLKNCTINRIYISAFPDFVEFKRHISNIAWDTEVWIADNPDHMIHFNGPKFFTLYSS